MSYKENNIKMMACCSKTMLYNKFYKDGILYECSVCNKLIYVPYKKENSIQKQIKLID